MPIEFIGSKKPLLGFVLGALKGEGEGERPRRVVDLFCGTASVSAALRDAGHEVVANDHLVLCSTFAEAVLLTGPRPAFAGLADEVPGVRSGAAYAAVVAALNALPPEPGFIHREYSPASARHAGVARMYLTERNAARVDAIRRTIAAWEPALTRGERALLLRDLVRAVSRVSNTAGTYGCYLKTWKERAREPLVLEPLPPARTPRREHTVLCRDAEDVAAHEADAVYADPPYTKRQYAAYYHLLETIAIGDEPVVAGATGLRPWHGKASDFCYRRRALAALERLVARLRCREFFLSYNEDGQMADEEIRATLGRRGTLRVAEREHRRYRSSSGRHKGAVVRERLYRLTLA
jgi:adenine-specific DNA-methyltransferase